MINSDNVTLKRIKYGELRGEKYDFIGDKYNIISGYFIDSTRRALLANPNYDNDTKSVLNVICYNEEIVGRHMLMPTKIKIGDKIVLAQTGGGHEICEKYQGNGLGTMIVRDAIMNSEYPIYLGQLYSSGAISILRKMDGLCIFEKPLYQKMLKTRSIIKAKGYKGFLLRFFSFVGDIKIKIRNIPNYIKLRDLKKKYSIKMEAKIPGWVNNLTMNDGHKYMEVHDQKWLQWNLSNTFSNNPDDRNYYFSIYNNGTPAGFLMTKERYEENLKGKYKNLTRGTIVEWGVSDDSGLSEADINLMAISTFSRKVDKINTVLSCDGTEKDIKKMGFTYRGSYQMVLKPAEDCETDIYDITLWRIRYGGANTILV